MLLPIKFLKSKQIIEVIVLIERKKIRVKTLFHTLVQVFLYWNRAAQDPLNTH